MQIWKYVLGEPMTAVTHYVPAGATFLQAQVQGDEVVLWAIVDPEMPKEERRFALLGTGYDLTARFKPSSFHGTVQQGNLVWHVFEVA